MALNYQRKRQAYSQPLFGRGPGGGASLREAASPGVPTFPRSLSGREREGGAFRRKAASLAYSFFYFVAFLFLDGVEPESLNGAERDFLEGLGVEMKLRGVLGNEDGCVGNAVGLVIE